MLTGVSKCYGFLSGITKTTRATGPLVYVICCSFAWTREAMPYGRTLNQAVLLPSGKVLVVNGGKVRHSDWSWVSGHDLDGSSTRHSLTYTRTKVNVLTI